MRANSELAKAERDGRVRLGMAFEFGLTFEVWHGGDEASERSELAALSAVATTDLFCIFDSSRSKIPPFLSIDDSGFVSFL